MKKMRILPILLLLFTFTFGQNNAIDAAAGDLLNKVAIKYQSYSTAKIDLNLSIDLPDEEENQEIAVQAWMKGDKFKIEMTDQLILSDNITIWNFLKEYNEVQINDYEASDAIFSPSIIFNLYTDDYAYRIKEEYKNANGELIKVVELTPIDKDQMFFKIELVVNTKTTTITQAKMFERSGMRYTYKIKTLTPNLDLSDDFFMFDASKYKDIEVIDSRF